jgi:GH25 family lysozyme M1 (1,4-beta-N-acetylmuramidase)
MNQLPVGQVHPDYTVGGLDLSYSQFGVNIEKSKSRGVKFIIFRAGWGVTKDIRFNTHRALCEKAGWPWGCYWYWHPAYLEKDQARKFKEVVGSRPALGVYPDFERNEGYGLQPWPVGMNQQSVSRKMYEMMDATDQLFGDDSSLYSSPGFLNTWLLSQFYTKMRASSRDLWLAQWFFDFAKRPTMPRGFSRWDFWQISGNSGPWAINGVREFGVSGSLRIDVNVFNGTQDEFNRKFHLIKGPGEQKKNTPLPT